MNKITSPLKLRMQEPAVADLQDALQQCLDRGALLANDEVGRQELAAILQRERAQSLYGDATGKLVSIFQKERRLRPNGEVDAPTADAINKLLLEWGLLDKSPTPAFRIVSGTVRRADGLPLQGVGVRAMHRADRTAIRLGDDTSDAEGRYTIRYESLPGVDTIDLGVSAIGEDGRALNSSKVVPNAKPIENIDLTVPVLSPALERQTIEGTIVLEHGLPAEQLKLRLCRRDFGGKLTLLSETTTIAGGRYAFAYDAGAPAASLEVRAVKADGSEIALSKPLNHIAGSHANLNLAAAGSFQPLAAEYRRMSADLMPHVTEMKNLAAATENAAQQDLTVLNRGTGWDARLIALAAVTERLAADPDVGLPSEALYGLLRAGLPSDKQLLAQVGPEVVEMALKKVRDAGIVEINDNAIDAIKTQFDTFANKTRLAMPAPGSRSTYGEFLGASNLPQQAQDKFAPIYLKHRGSGAELWEEARKAGIDATQVGKLQLQGKLAFLSGNGVAISTGLLKRGLKDPVELVGQGFHDADAWTKEVFEQADIALERRGALTEADREKLAAMIPEAYAAEGVEARLAAYSDDMARKLRLSYPTPVLALMMETDEKFKLPAGHEATVKLLKGAMAQGFRFGETPVTGVLKNAALRDGMSDAEFHTAAEQLKTMQRVYQLTPLNEAMPVLISLGMTSAFDVMAYPEKQFISLFKAKYLELHKKPAPPGVPELVSRKATQVSSITYNLFTIAKKIDSELPVAGMSAPVQVRESVKNELIKHYPTMESLFGSMDYCECEHCRSVLSPAAYLVDLLQFVDTEPAVWANFLALWKETHGTHDYPHKNAAGEAIKPYDVLIERRPDLSHIALTCENTNTALPYIDIVNEVLEYYVANGKLEKEAAHDTGDATTAELLAEPQNVIREAYDALGRARYPLNLPFDPWIATVRQFGDYFETPFHDVLEALRPNDELFAPTQRFDRAAIFMESLGLSPAEVAIFTDADAFADDRWHELYGLPAVRSVIQNPTNAGNATLNVVNAAAAKLKAGLAYSYFDTSANAISADTMILASVGAADSGGAGQASIVFESVWLAAPDAGDFLVCDAPAMLKSAKALSRLLGVTYKEITDIAQTGFVNPELDKLSLLYKLDISVRDAKLYKDEHAFYEANKDLLGKDRGALPPADQQRYDDLATNRADRQITGWQVVNEVAALEQRLADLARSFNPAPNVNELRAAIQAVPFERVLVLADPDAGCNFGLTMLQYADGAKADAIVFLRINLFVRLWRKLGWSIEETDRALTTLIPRSAPYDSAANRAKQPLKTALIYLAHLKTLDKTLKVGPQSRLKLLTLWSPMAITGKKPLYAQLFLSRSVLKSSPVFDHPLGKYLSTPSIKVKAHPLALQGALGLTADEIGRILDDAGLSFHSADLSLASVSLLYRYSLLAKALKLTVRELIALKQVSGLDPFKALHPDPLLNLEQNHPFCQTLEFVKVAEEVKQTGLKIEDLDYLLRHRFDEMGKYRRNREGALDFLKSLAEGVRAIRVEHAVPAGAGALAEEALRQKLGLLLRPEVVERFLGMVNTTAEFTATRSGVNAADRFILASFAPEQRIREVTYIEVPHHEQKLTVRGALFDPARAAMQARFDTALNATQELVFADLLAGVEKLGREFFNNQLKRQTLRLDGEAGFLEEADFAALFSPLQPLKEVLPTDSAAEVEFKRGENENIGKHNQQELQQRRERIAQAFLPVLQERLIRQFIVQAITAKTGADPALVASLVANERLLAAPHAMFDAFAATAGRGMTATFWASADASGAALPPVALPDADTGAVDKAGNPLKPAGADSARLDAYFEAPAAGAYRFYIELDKQNAEAELRLRHLPEAVLVKGAANADHAVLGDQPNEYLELQAGVLYHLSLELKHLNGGHARLLVQGETLSKGPLARLALYPAVVMDAAERALTLLEKALQLVQGMGLSEREIRYLLTHAADFGGLNLSELPTTAVGDAATEVAATAQRFRRFRRLVAYTRLKRNLAGSTDDLIGIFEANGTTAADRLDKQVYPLIAKLTHMSEATIKASAEALASASAVPGFESEKPLLRLWEALQVVERFGVPPASLSAWAEIVNGTTTGERRFEIARDLREAIKARFEPAAWQRVAQPIFDKLRQRQRDALVSHVMHQHGFDRPEQLYEYFLIDPGMEPVVQTSRIRLAISSLQLFIQRCLLNLEPKVNPSTIDARLWESHKRFRVWEVKRKLFLFPENWLEPEFRDDKTHLFTELEGSLLQGDVSNDLAEDAFLNYLKKMDELARLDICAMHIEDNFNPALRILHVFGRTYSQPHKYFYRRYAHQMWTPWEPVSAAIEGDHLAPVVWRDRLYLFWVTFLEKAEPPVAATHASSPFASVRARPAPGVLAGQVAIEVGPKETPIAEATVSEVTGTLEASNRARTVQAQLHWSEYLHGQWATSESSGFDADRTVTRSGLTNFDAKKVFVHVSKEYDPDDGAELGVFVHMGGAISRAFYLAGRNSIPEATAYGSPTANPPGPVPENKFTSANGPNANSYGGNGALMVSFRERVTTDSGKTPAPVNPSILQRGGSYTLLPCNNNLMALGVSEDAYRDAAKPAAVKAALESGLSEIASLVKPVFYQDNRHTLFMDPELTERTIEEWQDWVTRTPAPDAGWMAPDWWKQLVVVADIPRKGTIPFPGGPRISIDPASLIHPAAERDWLVNPASVVKFGDVLIGPSGQPGIEIHAGNGHAIGEGRVNINPGGGMAAGAYVVVRDEKSFAGSGLAALGGGLNVVGGAGFNSALEQNFSNLNRAGLGASIR